MSAKERSEPFRFSLRRKLARRSAKANDMPHIPRFKLVQKLGEGGMATVFLARQESTGRGVAIKILAHHLQADSRWAERFLDEARRLAELSHPNVVPVFDWGTHDGVGYIVMEYIKGGTLAQRLKSRPVTVREAIDITRQIAAGLDFASEKGYVHRDIKPDNILFREDGSLCILDFGIAKESASNTTITSQGIPFGTGAYMSPEQAQPSGKTIDGRSDLYSLGIVLFEILTGTRPFEFRQYEPMKAFQMYLFAHVHSPPPALPRTVAQFQPVMDKLLAKNPEDRFNRGNEVREALALLQSTLPEQELARSVRRTVDATILMPGRQAPDATPLVIHASDARLEPDPLHDQPHDQDSMAPEALAQRSPGGGLAGASLPLSAGSNARRKWTLAGLLALAGSSIGYMALVETTATPTPIIPTPMVLTEPAIEPGPGPESPVLTEGPAAPIADIDPTRQAIAERLAAASELMLTSPDNLAAQQQLVAHYQDILTLDADQADATANLDLVLHNQLAHARKLLDTGQLQAVPDHLTLIAGISPAAAASLQFRLETAQQEAEAIREKQAQLASLEQGIKQNLEIARRNPGQSRTALLKAAALTRDAVALDPNAADSAAYQKQIAADFTGLVQHQIERGNLASAQQALQDAPAAFVPAATVRALGNSIEQRQQQIARLQRQQEQEARAAAAAAARIEQEKLEQLEQEKLAAAAAAKAAMAAELARQEREAQAKASQVAAETSADEPAQPTAEATPEQPPPAKPAVRTFGSF